MNRQRDLQPLLALTDSPGDRVRARSSPSRDDEYTDTSTAWSR
jgi:hypothetical protein